MSGRGRTQEGLGFRQGLGRSSADYAGSCGVRGVGSGNHGFDRQVVDRRDCVHGLEAGRGEHCGTDPGLEGRLI